VSVSSCMSNLRMNNGHCSGYDEITELPSSSLKNLTIVLSYYAIDELYFSQQLRLVSTILSHLTHKSSLESLRLVIKGPVLSKVTVGEPDWQPMEVVLQRVEFSQLRLAVSYVACQCGLDGCLLFGRLADSLKGALDDINKSGRLTLNHWDRR
jgi:hypothetical protein